MTKIKTVKESFFFADKSSVGLTITLVLDDTSLLVCAVANDNTLDTHEVPAEMVLSAEVLGDELSEMQATMVESVYAKLNRISNEELQKFLGGGHIGLRYVFDAEGN